VAALVEELLGIKHSTAEEMERAQRVKVMRAHQVLAAMSLAVVAELAGQDLLGAHMVLPRVDLGYKTVFLEPVITGVVAVVAQATHIMVVMVVSEVAVVVLLALQPVELA
tara:strand:- start:151 stop:480 length:330 start_codon:yes stop_codon:yes gene_type:complete